MSNITRETFRSFKSYDYKKEKCANCKHFGKIYFPPRIIEDVKFDAVYLDGCFLFAHEKQVMYLEDIGTICECFEEKEQKK